MFKNNWESKLDFLGKYKFSNFDEIEQNKKVKQKKIFFCKQTFWETQGKNKKSAQE